MMQSLVIGAVGAPLLLALAAVTPLPARRLALLAALAPLPALLLALLAPVGLTLELSWLLLGARLGLDAVNLPFLLLTGLVWLAAAVYAKPYLAGDPQTARFYLFFLLTLVGNVGTVLALDVVSFYLFFTLMTFAAYGLIGHYGSAEALRAGKVYLILAVAGEALLLAATLLTAATVGVVDLRELPASLASAGGPVLWLVPWLALAGFAIKLGAVPLHVWLPLAHPSAPIPASAVLSGVLLKLGLLGWLRFLPFGELALPGPGQLCLLLGVVALFYGVAAGLLQSRPKTVLAYSSVSQMGMITLLAGVGLTDPALWPLVSIVLVLFTMHHGFAKAALFLGLGALTNRRALWLLVLPALALVGAPLTSGALAKLAVKSGLSEAALITPFGALDLDVVLTLSSLATGLLLARFFYLAWPASGARAGPTGNADLVLPGLALVLAGALLPWAWALRDLPGLVEQALQPSQWLAAGAAAATAAAVAVLAWLAWRAAGARPLPRVPEGDILALTAGLRLHIGLPQPGGQAWRPGPVWRRLARVKVTNERGIVLALLAVFAALMAR